MNNSKKKKTSSKYHSRRGIALLELLVALTLASLLALALCASIGQYMRLTTTMEGKELAAIMAQTALERIHNLPFDSPCLDVSSTTYDLVINDFDLPPGTKPCDALARPLLLDTANLQYSTAVANTSSAYHKFKGRVTLNIDDGPINPISNKPILGTKTATIHVYWQEPNATALKNLEIRSVLYRYGIQHHG